MLGASGVLRPIPPAALARMGRTLKDWGTGPAGGFIAMAIREPRRVGLIDEKGSLTWGELHTRSNALARALAARGVGEGDSVAIMCRNHRGFVEACVATAKLGADILLLNTAFAGPQLVDVLEREGPQVVIHDEEFTGLLGKARIDTRILGWVDSDSGHQAEDPIDALVTSYDDSDVVPPQRHARIVILTSGTTGPPRAPRAARPDSAPRWRCCRGCRCATAGAPTSPRPLFHTWGFAHLALAMLLGSTVVLRRRFDREGCLQAVEQERCESLVVIPVMLQRILPARPGRARPLPLPTLKVTAASGLRAARRPRPHWMDTFGDNLYNIYGSTEVAYASIATPADLRAAPTSAGKPPWGTVVKILDADGSELPHGETGRIFVGNGMLFEGYTGGGESKEVVDGLMSSGDVGASTRTAGSSSRAATTR